MKFFSLVLFPIFSIVFLIYLVIPGPEFPPQPIDSIQSVEPADSETMEKRAYFTNYSREEVLHHYQNQFKISLLGFDLPTYRLIYPPEDAYSLIRDQTRSTHLEEIVYPFRESFFINEFIAKEAKDDIWYKGMHYDQKITVKIKNSDTLTRSLIGLLTLVSLWLLVNEGTHATKELWSNVPNLKYFLRR